MKYEASAIYIIKKDGTMWGRGRNDGILMYPSTNNGNYIWQWTQIGTDSDWESVYVAGYKTNKLIAVKQDGSLWTFNVDSPTKNFFSSTLGRFVRYGTDNDWKGVEITSLISSGGTSEWFALLKKNGDLYYFGSPTSGGGGPNRDNNVEVIPTGLYTFSKIAFQGQNGGGMRAQHPVLTALAKDGTMVDFNMQLRSATKLSVAPTTGINSVTNFYTLSNDISYFYRAALEDDGSLHYFTDTSIYADLKPNAPGENTETKFKSMTSTWGRLAVISKEGTLFTYGKANDGSSRNIWGHSYVGGSQWDNYSYANRFASTGLVNVKSAAFYKDATFALKENGDLYACGDANYLTGFSSSGQFTYVASDVKYVANQGTVANEAPSISVSTISGSTIYDRGELTISGNSIDENEGDLVKISFKVDSLPGNYQLKEYISTGKSEPFSSNIRLQDGKLYHNQTAIGDFADGSHTLYISAIDSNDEVSNVSEITFNVINNRAPVITVSTINNATLYEGDKIAVSGSVTDSDTGNSLNLKYQINNNVIKSEMIGISNGSSSIPFNSSLLFKSSKIYIGPEEITPILDEGVPHTLKIWVEDNKGGKSVIINRVFYIVKNRPPELKITSSTFPNFAWTAKELDSGDKVASTEVKLNGVSIFKLMNPTFPQVVTVPITSLLEGDNTLTITATDSFNSTAVKNLKLTKVYSSLPETQLTTAIPFKSKEVKISMKRALGSSVSKIYKILGGYSL